MEALLGKRGSPSAARSMMNFGDCLALGGAIQVLRAIKRGGGNITYPLAESLLRISRIFSGVTRRSRHQTSQMPRTFHCSGLQH